jgi:hypothetical protein
MHPIMHQSIKEVRTGSGLVIKKAHITFMRGKILSIELAKSVTPQLKVPNPNMVSNYGKTIKIGCMCYPKARVPPLVLLVYVDPHIGHAFLLKTLGTKNLL